MYKNGEEKEDKEEGYKKEQTKKKRRKEEEVTLEKNRVPGMCQKSDLNRGPDSKRLNTNVRFVFELSLTLQERSFDRTPKS